MKKSFLKIFILVACGLSCFQLCRAQIKLSIALNSRPLPYLADWYKPINGQMIVSYVPAQSTPDATVKIKTTLLDFNGSVIANSNIGGANVYRLIMGANLFSMGDALQLQNLVLMGSAQNILQRTGRLIAGQYQLNVQIVNLQGDRIYAEQTRPFFVTSYQLPVLMQPANGASLDARVAQNVIPFRWTNVVPAAEQGTRYRVQVFEILPGQTDMQAYRSNRPLLDEEAIRGSNQFLWRTNLPMLDSTANNRFIWTVQTIDEKGQPLPTNDAFTEARSEPAVFTIYRKDASGFAEKK